MNYKNLIMVVLALALLAGVAQAAQYDFQDSGIGDWTYSGGTVTIDDNPDDDTYCLYMTVGSHATSTATPNLNTPFNYLAFTVVTADLISGKGAKFYLYLYDSEGTRLDSSPYLCTSIEPKMTTGSRFEFVRSGSYFDVYKDGVRYIDKSWEPGGTPYNFGLTIRLDYGSCHIRLDDIVIGASQPDILGTAGDSYFYILKDFDDPTNNGLYDADGIVHTDAFHTTYGVNTQVDRVDEIRIETYHIGTGYTVNTTTIDTHEHPAGVIEYDLDDLFFDDEDAPFGLYIQRMYDTADNDILDTVTLVYLSSMADCDFDTGIYYYGNTATVTWDIATNGTWDTGTYTYSGQIIDQYGSLIDEWNINTATGSHNDQITTDDYDDGTIYALLWAEEKATGDDLLIAYDIAEVDEAIVVSGTTYNVESGAALGTVDVTYTQGETAYEDTSSAGGAYEVTDLTVSTNTLINATTAGYSHDDYNWTPLASQQYEIDLYLMPDAPTHTNTSVNGIVYDSIYHQALESVTVTIENLTWSDTTTSSATGYYIFNSLYNGTYTVSTAAVPGFAASEEYEVTTLAENVTQQNVEMVGIYTLTVECRDRSDETLISDAVLLELSTGDTTSTSAGVGTFTGLAYGLYDLSGSTDEMSGTSEGVLVDGNETTTLYLSSSTGGGSGISYAPHNVKFIVQTIWGEPIAGVTVTATYVETSGPLDWIFEWLGISEDIDIEDTTLSATTGTDGAVNFMMVEAVQYHVTAVLAGVCDESFDVYPKDECYPIIVGGLDPGTWFEGGYNINEVINITTTSGEIDSTSAWINVTYADTLAGSSNLNIYINQTNSSAPNGTQTNIDSWNSAAPGEETYHNFTVLNHRGEDYFVNVIADHSTFTDGVFKSFGVHFKPAPITLGIPEEMLIWVAMFMMMFTMLMATQTSTGPVALVICFEGWIFWFMGWLDELGISGPVALTFATGMAVFYNIMLRSKREVWA